jgi:hypothetical protein
MLARGRPVSGGGPCARARARPPPRLGDVRGHQHDDEAHAVEQQLQREEGLERNPRRGRRVEQQEATHGGNCALALREEEGSGRAVDVRRERKVYRMTFHSTPRILPLTTSGQCCPRRAAG